MRHQDIRAGDRLKLKPDNPYGLGPAVLTVTALKTHDRYVTPWIYCEGWGYFKPSDFARRES